MCMYVCVDVTHPSEVEEAPALRREVLRAGAGPEAAEGLSGKKKGGGGEGEAGWVVPAPLVSAAWPGPPLAQFRPARELRWKPRRLSRCAGTS